MPTYLLHGQRISTGDPGFADALAAAHAGRDRPLCLCLAEGVEMYVARVVDRVIAKRLPYTGSQHAPDCLSYEPPADLSGLGQVNGSAISEDPENGITRLKLGFSMSRDGGRSIALGPGDGGKSAISDGTKLTPLALLQYLWDQAELTRWQPGFTGRRSWATVRKHLLLAAEGKTAYGCALQDRLYVPEPFSIERRDEILARRTAAWIHTAKSGTNARPLMLLIGEVKAILPTRFGCKAVIKHVPDTPFAMDEPLYRRMEKRFENELSLWGASDDVRMVMIGTFGLNDGGVPTIEELSLMPVTNQWLPIEDSFEQQLTRRLIDDGRSFVKIVRFNLPPSKLLATSVLTDSGDLPVALYIARFFMDGRLSSGESPNRLSVRHSSSWVWDPRKGAMPPLPKLSRVSPEVAFD